MLVDFFVVQLCNEKKSADLQKGIINKITKPSKTLVQPVVSW